MPTYFDSHSFGHKEYIDSSFRALGVTEEDIGDWTEGWVSEVVSVWCDGSRARQPAGRSVAEAAAPQAAAVAAREPCDSHAHVPCGAVLPPQVRDITFLGSHDAKATEWVGRWYSGTDNFGAWSCRGITFVRPSC
jgi:hypothetical protein